MTVTILVIGDSPSRPGIVVVSVSVRGPWCFPGIVTVESSVVVFKVVVLVAYCILTPPLVSKYQGSYWVYSYFGLGLGPSDSTGLRHNILVAVMLLAASLQDGEDLEEVAEVLR